jgi:hypothetical protein
MLTYGVVLLHESACTHKLLVIEDCWSISTGAASLLSLRPGFRSEPLPPVFLSEKLVMITALQQ